MAPTCLSFVKLSRIGPGERQGELRSVGTRSEFVRQTFRAPKVLGNAAIELLASVQVYCFKLSMGLERKRALLYEADKPRIMHISKLVKTLSPYGPETPTLAGCDKVLV